MNTLPKIYLALAGLCTVLTPVSVLSAELDPGNRTVPVSLAGMDLTDPKGVEKVYTRVRNAAQSVCKNLHTLELGKRRAKWQRCVDDALARAIADINSPALTAYSATKSGKKPALLAQDR